MSGKCTPGVTGCFAFWGASCARSCRACSEQYTPAHAAPITGSATHTSARKSVIKIGICVPPAFSFFIAAPLRLFKRPGRPDSPVQLNLYQYMGAGTKDIHLFQNIVSRNRSSRRTAAAPQACQSTRRALKYSAPSGCSPRKPFLQAPCGICGGGVLTDMDKTTK